MMTVSDDGSKAPPPGPPRGLLIAGVTLAAVVAAVGAGFGVAQSQTEQRPEKSAAPLPSPSATPVVTDTPVESEAAPRALPTDCRAIYTQEFLDTHANVDLNMPEVTATGISRFPAVEAIREELQSLECYWGGPTEGGLQSAVNALPADQLESTIAAVRTAGAACGEWDGGTLCRYSTVLEPNPDDPSRWTIAEQYYFRDGWWVTTWQAGTVRSIDEDTQPLYTTLWP